MAMIQTKIQDGRGGYRELSVNDPEYWEGPHRHEAYPKALYQQLQPGKQPEERTVRNQQEHERLGASWHESPEDARRAFERLEASIAAAAAERANKDRMMSGKAFAESLMADRATDEMLPEIPEKKRRGRKPKAATTVAES